MQAALRQKRQPAHEAQHQYLHIHLKMSNITPLPFVLRQELIIWCQKSGSMAPVHCVVFCFERERELEQSLQSRNGLCKQSIGAANEDGSFSMLGPLPQSIEATAHSLLSFLGLVPV